jgi:hypothetical protein
MPSQDSSGLLPEAKEKLMRLAKANREILRRESLLILHKTLSESK